MPLANAFLRGPGDIASESAYPLDVYFCETCSLVQLLDVVDREVLFRHYLYVTGTSDTIAAHNADYARAVVGEHELGASDLVVEVASNDGSLLRCFQSEGVRTLGVEPATNIAAMARDAGVETVNVFFDRDAAASIAADHGEAAAVVANNVLAHVDDPADFLRGCCELIRPDGVVVVEVPELTPMLDRLEYDTIYHEHLSYFSVTSLMALFESAGLSIVRVDRFKVHGGSLRVHAMKQSAQSGHSADVMRIAAGEQTAGLTSIDRYRKFAADVSANRAALLRLLEELRSDGHTLAGYGAPAKGNTLLNYCGIGPDILPFTVDRSPLKVGLVTPGMHIPVLPVAALVERQPDYALVLAWNFADEIVRQQREYASRGGQFIIPIPEPRVIL
jgi:SAM-dependent methyltransferase